MFTSRPATLDDEPRVLELLPQLMQDESANPSSWSAGYRLLLVGYRGTALVVEDETGVLGCITVSAATWPCATAVSTPRSKN